MCHYWSVIVRKVQYFERENIGEVLTQNNECLPSGGLYEGRVRQEEVCGISPQELECLILLLCALILICSF